MDLITRFSLKNVTVVVLAALMVTLGGVYTSGKLAKETMPDVSIPIIALLTPYPGASPTDVYDEVTAPLERALSGVQGIDGISGTSADSVSVIVGEFDYSVDLDEVEAEMLKAVDGIELPENAFEPEVVRISFGSQPIVKIAVSGGESDEWLRDTVRDDVRPLLESIDGVGDVSMSNDDPGSVRVVFDPDALEEHGLTAQDVVQQLQASNLSFPVGSVVVDDVEEPIRVSGRLETVEDIEQLKVAVYPNMNAIYGDALGEIGRGMAEIGGAVGEMGEGLGMQIGLVAALQSTQVDLLEARIAVAEAQTVLLDSAASPDDVAAASATIAQMSAAIPALEAAVAGIEDQLADAQAAAGGGTSVPSASAAEEDTEPVTGAESEEPSIGLVDLGELAEVTFEAGLDATFSRMDGSPAILLDVTKSQDANTVAVSDAVRATLDSVAQELPDDVGVRVTYDAAEYIESSIWDMIREGIVGGIFAFIVMLVFLRNWRSTLIAAVSIPLSIVASLLVIGQFDVTLNIMTLGGITVAIGRIVDDSIVVIENIYRHLQIGDPRSSETIRVATKEVSSAITSSTLTTVAVFAPMAMVSGIVGKVFTPFALTVAVALLSSLLVSVTLVPLLAKWTLLRAKVPSRSEEAQASTSYYARLLRWSLDHKKSVMAGATTLFFASLALIPIIGLGFMPPSTENFANIDVRFPAGTTADTVDAALAEVEEALAAFPDVEYHQASVGTASGFNVAASTNQGSVFLKFDDEADMEVKVDELRDEVAFVRDLGADVTVAATDVSGAGANSIDIIITGPDFDDIKSAAAGITSAIDDIDDLENVSSNVSEERPQISVDVDQVAAAEYGLNTAMVAGTVRGYVADEQAGIVGVDGQDVELEYSIGLDGVMSAEDVAAIELATPLGDTVAVGDIAHVEETGTPVSVLTLDERRFAAVFASVTARNSNEVIVEVQQAIDDLSLPEGVEVEIGGMAEMMAESFEQLGLAMLIAVFAVYLVMVIAFGEAVAPLAIMGSLPLAIIGGILGLFVAGLPLDMPAMIGALMLIGIVTTNAIVLIDRVNQKLDDGRSRRDSLIEAGAERIRPILMTALTTIGALLPMAFGMAEGALMSQSLAVIVVGGLTTSTGLTLVVVPVVYDWLEGLKDRVLARGVRKLEAAETTT